LQLTYKVIIGYLIKSKNIFNNNLIKCLLFTFGIINKITFDLLKIIRLLTFCICSTYVVKTYDDVRIYRNLRTHFTIGFTKISLLSEQLTRLFLTYLQIIRLLIFA